MLRGTTSGVIFNPKIVNTIPRIIITNGADRAELPKDERSGHKRASLLGKEANPRIPNGHQTIAGPGIGKR